MIDTPQPPATSEDDGIFAHPDAVAALAQAAFARAKKAAIERNDRHGIPSYGAENGRIVVRQPAAAKASAGPT
jgi:hypothetical protein